MIVKAGPRAAAVETDNSAAKYPALREIVGASDASVDPDRQAARAVVEIYRHLGGMAQRGMLGGSFMPGGDHLAVTVAVSFDELGPSCPSQLWRPMRAGLPVEYAEQTLRTLMAITTLPAGELRIDRAAHDPVDSSEAAFDLVAGLLADVLDAKSRDGDLASSVQENLERWP